VSGGWEGGREVCFPGSFRVERRREKEPKVVGTLFKRIYMLRVI